MAQYSAKRAFPELLSGSARRWPLAGLILVAPIWGEVEAGALQSRPFNSGNKNPLVAIFGLPLVEPAAVLAGGHASWQLTVDVANSFRVAGTDGEDIYLDGETGSAHLTWRRGVGRRWELGLELPLIYHGGGFLDPLIDNFHRALGIDRMGRDETPSGELLYAVTRDGEPQVVMDSAGGGVGDLQLRAGYRLLARPGRWLSLRGGLKAPTGDADRLFGSGGWDGSVGLYWLDARSWSPARLSYGAAAGVLYTQDGEVLPDMRQNAALYGSAYLAWQWRPVCGFKLQFDGNTALYDSGLRELGSASVQALLGATVAATRHLQLDLAIGEDLVVDTSPDLVLHFALRYAR